MSCIFYSIAMCADDDIQLLRICKWIRVRVKIELYITRNAT